MLEKVIEEMKKIVDEVKSPFSYIHDKLVEAFGHVHKELEDLKARIQLLEGGPAPMEDLHAQANVLREKIAASVAAAAKNAGIMPNERISYPESSPPLLDHVEADK